MNKVKKGRPMNKLKKGRQEEFLKTLMTLIIGKYPLKYPWKSLRNFSPICLPVHIKYISIDNW